MNLKGRVEKLENIQNQRADEIRIEARGHRFYIDKREITAEELTELSTKDQQIVVTNYLDDEGFKLLESLNCDVEIRGKYYIGFDPNCWDSQEVTNKC